MARYSASPDTEMTYMTSSLKLLTVLQERHKGSYVHMAVTQSLLNTPSAKEVQKDL